LSLFTFTPLLVFTYTSIIAYIGGVGQPLIYPITPPTIIISYREGVCQGKREGREKGRKGIGGLELCDYG